MNNPRTLTEAILFTLERIADSLDMIAGYQKSNEDRQQMFKKAVLDLPGPKHPTLTSTFLSKASRQLMASRAKYYKPKVSKGKSVKSA